MTWFGYSLMVVSIVIFALAWLKGGHPERLGAVLMTTAFLVAALAPRVLVLGDLILYDAVSDTVLLAILLWMSFKGNRWWPFFAAAAMFLTDVVHVAMVLIPELDTRADMSARMGLTLLMVLALLAGVGERWLAGERPVSELANWGARTKRRQTLNI